MTRQQKSIRRWETSGDGSGQWKRRRSLIAPDEKVPDQVLQISAAQPSTRRRKFVIFL